MQQRRFSSYRVGQTEVDRLSREELIETVRMFCADASDDLLRRFIKDITDEAGEKLEAEGYATIS